MKPNLRLVQPDVRPVDRLIVQSIKATTPGARRRRHWDLRSILLGFVLGLLAAGAIR